MTTPDILTDEELDELDAALATPPLDECSMTLSELDGYFTALSIGPNAIKPEYWLPWVWDAVDGEEQPALDRLSDANRLLSLLMRFHAEVIQRLADAEEPFRPIYLDFEGLSPEEWCAGFFLATSFEPEAWDALMAEHPEWFDPLSRLAGVHGEGEAEPPPALADDPVAVGPLVLNMRQHWLADRASRPQPNPLMELTEYAPLVHPGPKVGRNDPCPCGSGKKFKKCCGAG